MTQQIKVLVVLLDLGPWNPGKRQEEVSYPCNLSIPSGDGSWRCENCPKLAGQDTGLGSTAQWKKKNETLLYNQSRRQ